MAISLPRPAEAPEMTMTLLERLKSDEVEN